MAGQPTNITARAQRRPSAPKITPQASYLGSPRTRRTMPRSELPIAPAEIIPDQPTPARPAGEAPARHYRAREHVRRDIGTRIEVLDLAAPDTPSGAPRVLPDADGTPMPFLVRCVSHGARKHFTAYSSAVRAAKASHHWCEPCKRELIAFHKLHARSGSH